MATLTNHYWELAEYLEHVVNASRDLTWPDNDTLITSYYTAVEQALNQKIVAGTRAQVSCLCSESILLESIYRIVSLTQGLKYFHQNDRVVFVI